MSAPFKPGDVVVCVDDRPGHFGTAPNRLRRGAHYRICDTYTNKWGEGCTLVGVDHSPARGFYCYRFRKIDDEVTESFREQLRAIKTPVKQSPGGLIPSSSGSARGITASHSDAPRAAHSEGSR